MTQIKKLKTQISKELLDDKGWVEGNITGNSFPENSNEVLVDDNGYLGLPSITQNTGFNMVPNI